MSAKAMIRRALRLSESQGAVAATMSRTARQGSGPSAAWVAQRASASTGAEVSASDLAAFRRMLDLGSHGAQGLHARERLAASRALTTMLVIDRAQAESLVHAFDQGAAVRELVRYAATRHL